MKQNIKISVDIAMTASLLLLMTYERIGQASHEWLGIGMLVLFVLHHILKGKWNKNLLAVSKWIPRAVAIIIAG